MHTEAIQRRVRVALGREAGDLLLTGGRVVNVFTGAVETADVVIADGVVAGVGPYEWTARETIDVTGRFVVPGLVDAHMHIESTLLTPAEFARIVVPRGTSMVVADPHEIGNVLGVRGIEQMLRASAGLPLDCFFMAPSCVPASPFEAAGADLDAAAVATLMAHDRVLGLAEMMNFPGVLGSDGGVLDKVAAARVAGGVVDGHCPGLVGRDLVAYAAAGIESDHECTTTEEAVQRAALGMLVQVREGSMARNLDTFLPLMAAGELGAWCLCTDDIHPEDLLEHGHIDGLLRRVVAGGVPAPTAIRHASLVPARHYGLRGRGAVAPGFKADLAVFDDLERFDATVVVHDGAVVARDGAYEASGAPPTFPSENTIHLGPLDASSFRVPAGADPLPVIGVIPDQIVTRHDTRTVPHADGAWVFDPGEDVAMVACIQRHEPTGAMGVGLVAGLGFARPGAFGSSVGHDAHNLVVAGTNGDDMLACARALEALGGGFAVVADGAVTEQMALPVAGLLSTEPAADVCRRQQAVNEAARALGCSLHSPFGTLSFLPLTVIPALKITDRGLFDVETFSLVGSGAAG
jgi:adenine deaminase